VSDVTTTKSPQATLTSAFGGYRAEWLREQLFELFTEPSYFPEMRDERPCILVGGRGTGKTTVLKGLSYEGQFAFAGKDVSKISSWQYYGLYYRVNTNRVTAFRGSERTEEQWVPIFGHYFNLILCDLILEFASWYQLQTGTAVNISTLAHAEIAASLHTQPVDSLKELTEQLQLKRIAFEASVNNIADENSMQLSLQGAPVEILIKAFDKNPAFHGRSWYFLIDEYENFEPYQQQVVNTLIKHSGQHYTFKIGVKELGIRRKNTLNENEQLISPSDYVLIDIAEKLKGSQFESFALKVCNDRIKLTAAEADSNLTDIRELLPSLGETQGLRVKLIDALPSEREAIDSLSDLELYFLAGWAEKEKVSLEVAFKERLANRKSWDERFGNNKHGLLFALNRGRRGIRRYYAGWSVFVLMASSNIRYLLELVDQSLQLHFIEGQDLRVPVPAETQTKAAQQVGKKNLAELEGLSVYGAKLTKLLLSLGRVFGQMAAEPFGHAPEVNQFHLTDFSVADLVDESLECKALALLESGIMHLALLRWPGNKLGAESETKDYDYAVHPIFSAFFVFSHRKKRKMILSPKDLIGFVESSQETIRDVLRRSNRDLEPIPEQLEIFKGFYENS